MTAVFNLLFVLVLSNGILTQFSQNNPQSRLPPHQMRPVKTLQRCGLNYNKQLMQQQPSETISQFPEYEQEKSQFEPPKPAQWQSQQRQDNQFNYNYGQMFHKSENDSLMPPADGYDESIEVSKLLPYQQSQTQQSMFPYGMGNFLPNAKTENQQQNMPFNPLEQSQVGIFDSQVGIFDTQSQFSVVNPNSQFGQQVSNDSSGKESSFVHILSPDVPYVIRNKSTNQAFYCDRECDFPSESFLKMSTRFLSFFSINYVPFDHECVYISSVDFPTRVFEILDNSVVDGESLRLNFRDTFLNGQKFRIIQSLRNSGFYQIQAVRSRKCLQSTFYGVQQFPCNDSDNQLFSFIRG